MTTRAEVFAEAHARLAGDSDCLHIYEDGYVLVVACSADRHLTIRKSLRKFFAVVEDARSRDGFLSAWVLPADVGGQRYPELPGRGILVVLTEGYTDHRMDDAYRLDDAAAA